MHHSRVCRPQCYCLPGSRLNEPTAEPHRHRAVFLDRDGTVVKDIGYLTTPSELELLPGVIEGIRLLQSEFLIVIVTNQSVVARRLLDEKGLLSIHQSLAEILYGCGACLDALYACLHLPEAGCRCRKPQPGLLLQASADLGIAPGRSFMIGDKGADILTGQRAGVAATVLVRSPQTAASLTPELAPTYVADDLYSAARLILDHQARSD